MQLKLLVVSLTITGFLQSNDQKAANQNHPLTISIEDEAEMFLNSLPTSPTLPGQAHSLESATIRTDSSAPSPIKGPKRVQTFSESSTEQPKAPQTARDAWLSRAQEEHKLATREAQLATLHRQATIKRNLTRIKQSRSNLNIFSAGHELPKRESLIRRWLKRR